MSNSETYMKINDCKIFPEKLLARRVCDDFWWIVVPSADAVPSQHACSQLAEIQRSVHTAQSWVDQRRSESHPARNVVADINIHEHTTPVHFFQILKRKFENKLLYIYSEPARSNYFLSVSDTVQAHSLLSIHFTFFAYLSTLRPRCVQCAKWWLALQGTRTCTYWRIIVNHIAKHTELHSTISLYG